MKTMRSVQLIAGVAAIVFVFLGCFIVLRPFLSAILWAAILCYATWPLYTKLCRILRGWRSLAALVMVLLISLVMVLPFVIVGMTFADDVRKLLKAAEHIQSQGLPTPPAWVNNVPVVGEYIHSYWLDISASTEKSVALVESLVGKASPRLFKTGLALGEGIVQLLLSVLIAFFFYRSGEVIAAVVSSGMQRMIGESTQRLISVAGNTVTNVVYGILGTALSQGILAGIGFLIVGVPFAPIWALLTFLLALLPFGPPLIWIPAAIWLLYCGRIGAGVFMALWGLFGISGIDNILRPYLISRGGTLPFLLVLLGVLGGVLAFGFIGIFIGPTLLATGYCLTEELIKRQGIASHVD